MFDFSFEPAAAPPEDQRKAYLDGLETYQEYFIEERIAAGQTWCISDLAYVVADDTDILEFHVDTSARDRLKPIFDAARRITGASSALCKSFDRTLLFAALPARVSATGILFRSLWGQPRFTCPGTLFRDAEAEDLTAVAAIGEDFFSGPSEIERLHTQGHLCVLERAGRIIAAGTRMPVAPDQAATDLGMVVAPDERGRGYGTHVIARMRDDVLALGRTPVCACAARNVASWRTLRKAGFVDDHRLLRIEFDPN